MDSTLHVLDPGLFEIQCQVRMVAAKYVAIIAVKFIYTKRPHDVIKRRSTRTQCLRNSAVVLGVKVYGTVVG